MMSLCISSETADGIVAAWAAHRALDDNVEVRRVGRGEQTPISQHRSCSRCGRPGRFLFDLHTRSRRASTPPGTGISFGEWIHRDDGYWALRFCVTLPEPPK